MRDTEVSNAANIFMAVIEAEGDGPSDAERPGALVVTTTMREAHTGAGRLVQHEMKPAFHPLAMPNWRDCLTCWVCGYTLVTQRMFAQAPHWTKVYLAALYLEGWAELLDEVPEGADAGPAD